MEQKLKWLMRALNISGVELADHLGIDYSIVSKWRTGKRKIKYQSAHARELAAYVFSTQAEQEGHIIRDMLTQTFPDLDPVNRVQLENALCLWLTIPEKPAQASVLKSKDFAGAFPVQVETAMGIRNAIHEQSRFFKILLKLPAGQTLNILDFGALAWEKIDASYVDQTVMDTLAALAHGHRINIIDLLTDTYRPWDFMFRFIPIYLHDHVTSFYYRDPKPSPLQQNIMVAAGQVALTISSTPLNSDLILSSFYQQTDYIRFYEDLSHAVMKDSHLMIQKMKHHQLLDFLEIIDQNIKGSRLLYMINKTPTFRNMPQELLQEILDKNKVDPEGQSICLAANQKSTAIRSRCMSRQIYDLDAIEAQTDLSEIIEYDLSAILGRTIRLTKNQYLRHLQHLKNTIRAENYALVLYPFSQLNMSTPPPVNIIVQDDSLSAAWDVEKFTNRMYSEDLSIVNGFFQYAQSAWEHLPSISKTEEWCGKQIDRILTLHGR